jgi:hypothetical protein
MAEERWNGEKQGGGGASIPIEPRPVPCRDACPVWLDDDPQWKQVRRIVAGRHFSRSPLLSKFLLYIVAETIEGRQDEITEHQIGVQVFGRPAGYRTVEDNIVRNYARQLRKRLAEYFAGDGRDDPQRIEIPSGGYVPVFLESANNTPVQLDATSREPGMVQLPAPGAAADDDRPAAALQWNWRWILMVTAPLAAYSCVLVGLTWLAMTHMRMWNQATEPAQILWQTLLNSSSNIYIVPSDAGFNLLEDLSHHSVLLASYIKGGYLELPLPQVDSHTVADLRTQQFTDFTDLQIVAALLRLPQYDPRRVFLRFPRDLRIDDLKDASAIIVGSVCSNPWAAIADFSVNFRIVCGEGMQGSTIVNTKPQPGEQASYASHWNEPAHETYALITFLPNLRSNGHVLLLEGLDVAGTQAAAETVLHSDAIYTILRQAVRPDGSLGSFEVLLRSTSIQSNATDIQVIASRIR